MGSGTGSGSDEGSGAGSGAGSSSGAGSGFGPEFDPASEFDRASGFGRASGSDPHVDEPRPVDPAKEQRKATDLCYALLAARARTQVELRDALLRKGIREETADLVLGKFDRAGLIDDAAFAEVWVRSRHTYQGLGRRALAVELRRKGVADEVAAEAIAAVDDEAEEERARELVRKKLRPMAGLDDTTKIRRLVSALARKGYSQGLAYRVVRDELSRAGEETAALDDLTQD
ncbi:regulatory protein RecX [Saccharothrix xinjiangensis]|uniref:Regulatory protein RecX n=1 Tax=Saccharothrix xinjiangensis TaxID=204798 RepID=A0ABV9YB90_9PSEU